MPQPAPDWSFPSIRGGEIRSSDLAGKAVFLVNTASLCGYTPQYAGLQDLQDVYGPRGLVVVAVPSNDFEQEKDSNDAVRDYCEGVFGLTLPMAEITRVKGEAAHPLYRWLAESAGYEPEWNFAKVLFDRDGRLARTFAMSEEPMGDKVVAAVEKVL